LGAQIASGHFAHRLAHGGDDVIALGRFGVEIGAERRFHIEQGGFDQRGHRLGPAAFLPGKAETLERILDDGFQNQRITADVKIRLQSDAGVDIADLVARATAASSKDEPKSESQC
jgi:hypothetical protein